jgi:hypothetical protein
MCRNGKQGKVSEKSWVQWLTPVIPATWEAEVGKIMDWGEFGQKS